MEQDSKSAGTQPYAWKSEALQILNWIERHMTLLAASTIVLPGVSTFFYISRNNVPLSITSSDLLSALPLILVIIALATLSLGALVLLPFSVLFETAERKVDGSIRLLPPRGEKRAKAIFLWLFVLAMPGVVFGLGWIAIEFFLPNNKWSAPVTAVTCVGVMSWMTYSRIPRDRVEKFSGMTLLIAIGSSLSQVLVVLEVMLGVMKLFDSESSVASIVLGLIAAVAVLAFLQICMLALVEVTSGHAGVLKQACLGGGIFVVLLCLFPPTGARLAGNIISRTAMGGHSCVQLGLTAGAWSEFTALRAEPANPKLSPEGGGADNQHHTTNLRVLANVGGAYLVRRQEEAEGRIYRIPADQTKFIQHCPNRSASKS